MNISEMVPILPVFSHYVLMTALQLIILVDNNFDANDMFILYILVGEK